ncbi:hypothetical protein FA95DRAFT_1614056 [Auriscalpium vulgare]|uniref:Uncharacterized protein n=1 Tax=Auriscalpium vulgare TaxID=40419 RepID=A0ACB8R109_9AGAM|nr:hypothetical protein FA95DRAFT_1614056 [Auriscalpium vulgare]
MPLSVRRIIEEPDAALDWRRQSPLPRLQLHTPRTRAGPSRRRDTEPGPSRSDAESPSPLSKRARVDSKKRA